MHNSTGADDRTLSVLLRPKTRLLSSFQIAVSIQLLPSGLPVEQSNNSTVTGTRCSGYQPI